MTIFLLNKQETKTWKTMKHTQQSENNKQKRKKKNITHIKKYRSTYNI